MRKLILSLPLLLLLVTSYLAIAGEAYVFDHKIHVEDGEMACAECHKASDSGSPVLGIMPSATVCMDCHDAEILTALPERPSSHFANHRHEHQFQARAGENDCMMCHSESESCTLCHLGENVDFVAHERDWLYTHPLDARQGSENCASCHDTQTYCADCHMQMGIKPGDHFPTGSWLQPTGHGDAAQFDLGSCVTCHGGPTPVCLNCHN